MKRMERIAALLAGSAMILGITAQFDMRNKSDVELALPKPRPFLVAVEEYNSAADIPVLEEEIGLEVPIIRSVYDKKLKREAKRIARTDLEIMMAAVIRPKPLLHKLSIEIAVAEQNKANELAYIKKAIKMLPVGSEIFAGEPIEKSIECLAKNIFNEGRGEILAGQLGIALVTLNRAKNNYYPNTICEVVYQKLCAPKIKYPVYDGCTAQFTWTWDGNPKNDYVSFTNKNGEIIETRVNAWSKAVSVAVDVLFGRIDDFTDGALHYYNHNESNPKWARSAVFITPDGFTNGIIGNHRFLVHTKMVSQASK